MKINWEELNVAPATVLLKCWVSLGSGFVMLFKEGNSVTFLECLRPPTGTVLGQPYKAFLLVTA